MTWRYSLVSDKATYGAARRGSQAAITTASSGVYTAGFKATCAPYPTILNRDLGFSKHRSGPSF